MFFIYSMKRVYSVSEILQILKEDGWILVRQKGSHRHLKHPLKKGIVTVPGHPGDNVHPKTLKSILEQAGIRLN
jgi:predicted RNA binding protein YcfA (HicA-like mRNA interferase family)